jgi:hypothetical protein
MNRMVKAAGIAAMAGLSASAYAQDSTGIGGVSDALYPYDLAHQRVSYVLDLSSTTTSWENTFGVGPLMKTAKTNASFNNNLLSGNGISQTNLTNVNAFSPSYSVWVATPGAGVHPTNNTAGEPVLPPSGMTQFAAIMSDFDQRYNGVTTAIVNYNPADPARLFVTRINTAVNGTVETADDAQFGVGAVDAAGYSYFRGDASGSTAGNNISGNNLFRTAAQLRNPARLNHVSATAAEQDPAAFQALVLGSSTTTNTPACIPSDRAGNPVIAGSNFGPGYIRGVNTVTTDTSHFSGTTATDHRGGFSYSPVQFVSGSVGTLAILGVGPSTTTDSIILADVDASGTVLRKNVLTKPASVNDPTDAYTPPLGNGPFDHYRSQVAFRGGNGQVAVGYNPFGEFGVVAAVTYDGGVGANDPYQSLLVGHFDPADPDGTVTWRLAGWVDVGSNLGKPIKSGPGALGGTVIGRQVPLSTVTNGSVLGPSISAPAIDAAGNIWFVAAAEQYKTDDMGVPFTDFDSILIRAVYDANTGGYELERVLEPGFTRVGNNSGTRYTLTFLGIADSNSIDSDTLFSNGLNGSTWNNMDTADLEGQQDPRSLGGLVLSTEITYETGEEYQCLMYVGNILPGPDNNTCPADLTGSSDPNDPSYGVPDGDADADDFFFYLDLFVANNGDLTGSSDPNDPSYGVPDGDSDADDFFFYLDLFVGPCL